MVEGPFNIAVDGQLMLPEQPLSQTGSHQNVSLDWVNNRLYSTQIINGGVLLPGEVAPAKTQAQRANAGDLAITEMTRTGTITGVMYARSMGHGVSLSAEPVGSDTYLWMEADAVPDGVFGYARQVGRVKFVAGTTVDASSPLVEKFQPWTGVRRVLSSVDFQNDRIMVSAADMTTQRNRSYRTYNLSQFRLGIFNIEYTWPIVGLNPDRSLQNHVLYGDFVYQLTGHNYSATNPPPGDSTISCTDITTGLLAEKFDNFTAVGLNNREPEALNVDHSVPSARLFFGFSTNAPAPVRFCTLYYWDLRGFVPPDPPPPDIEWIYTTNTVEEAPFAWNSLMQRYRIPRGISTVEVSPGVYEETRFDSYTDELDTLAAGLHYFRGGYEHRIRTAIRQQLIASGVATAANFVPA